MKLTIDKKIALFISLLIVVFGAVLGLHFFLTQTRLLNRGLNEVTRLVLDELTAELEYPLLVGNREAVAREVKKALRQHEVVFCRVEERGGALVYQEGERGHSPSREFSAPIVARISGGAEGLILDAPHVNSEEIGKVILEVSLADLRQKIFRTIGTVASVVIAAILLASLGSYLLLRRLVGRPVGQLVEATRQLAAGDLGHKVALTTRDEFEALGDSFNHMTASLREAQEELVRREKLAMLAQLAGSVGNELRNPLGVMSNAVFFLKSQLPDAGGPVSEYLEIINSEIEGAQRILTDFIDYFRTRAPRPQPVAVAELVVRCIEHPAIPEQVTVTLDLPETLPPLQVDPAQMRKALQNLISNAVQAMPWGGALRVSARQARGTRREERGEEDHNLAPRSSNLEPDGDFVEITVEDTGCGIAPENVEKLFQPLFTTKSRGVGLGLPICKNLVEANGGRIAVSSEVGKGTTFMVRLPVG
jgi:signal transduction histidine kinase